MYKEQKLKANHNKLLCTSPYTAADSEVQPRLKKRSYNCNNTLTSGSSFYLISQAVQKLDGVLYLNR